MRSPCVYLQGDIEEVERGDITGQFYTKTGLNHGALGFSAGIEVAFYDKSGEEIVPLRSERGPQRRTQIRGCNLVSEGWDTRSIVIRRSVDCLKEITGTNEFFLTAESIKAGSPSKLDREQ